MGTIRSVYMGCYLCQNDYDNVHACIHVHITICMSTCVYISCQHAYTHLQYYAAWDVNNYDLSIIIHLTQYASVCMSM